MRQYNITYKFNNEYEDIVPARVYKDDIEVTDKIQDCTLIEYLHKLNNYLYQQNRSEECNKYGYRDDTPFAYIEDVVEDYKSLLSFTIEHYLKIT